MDWIYLGPPGGFVIVLLLLLIAWCRRHPTRTILTLMLIAVVVVIALVVSAIGSCIDKINKPSPEEKIAMYKKERQETEAYIDSIMSLPSWKTLDAALTDSLGSPVLAWYGFDDSYAPARQRPIGGNLSVKYRDKLVSVVASYVETPDGKGEIREMWFKDSDGNPVDIHKVKKVK